jgi:hypothetical protein
MSARIPGNGVDAVKPILASIRRRVANGPMPMEVALVRLSNLGGTAADVMVTTPKTMPSSSTIDQVRHAFEDDHLHMLLLTSNDKLVGTLIRSDIPLTAAPCLPALPLARLDGRWTAPTTPVAALASRLEHMDQRRLAVVDSTGALLGLVCLKRKRHGFCSDADVTARAGNVQTVGTSRAVRQQEDS